MNTSRFTREREREREKVLIYILTINHDAASEHLYSSQTVVLNNIYFLPHKSFTLQVSNEIKYHDEMHVSMSSGIKANMNN